VAAHSGSQRNRERQIERKIEREREREKESWLCCVFVIRIQISSLIKFLLGSRKNRKMLLQLQLKGPSD